MIYGGTIKPGYSETLRKPINISTCYEAHGAFLYDTLKSEADPSLTKDDIMSDIEQHACPGSGACGGMVCQAVPFCEVMLILLVHREHYGHSRRGVSFSHTLSRHSSEADNPL